MNIRTSLDPEVARRYDHSGSHPERQLGLQKIQTTSALPGVVQTYRRFFLSAPRRLQVGTRRQQSSSPVEYVAQCLMLVV